MGNKALKNVKEMITKQARWKVPFTGMEGVRAGKGHKKDLAGADLFMSPCVVVP